MQTPIQEDIQQDLEGTYYRKPDDEIEIDPSSFPLVENVDSAGSGF